MTRLWARARALLEAGHAVALVSIREAAGSTPRDTDARMLVSDDGTFCGTIGGGSLEWEAIKRAQRHIRQAGPEAYEETFVLGPHLGQCCGGTVVLLIERITSDRLGDVASLADLEERGPFQTVAKLHPDGTIRRSVVVGAVPAEARENGASVETFGTHARPVYIFGAGHVGRALMLALAPLPFAVRLIDSRQDWLPKHLPANARTVHTVDPVTEISRAEDGTFALVMTHSHALDLEIVAAALANSGMPYVGLIGSKTKRARFAKRLALLGLGEACRDRLTCPIGVTGITGKEPAVIALSAAAQALQVHEQLLRERDDRQPASESRGWRHEAFA